MVTYGVRFFPAGGQRHSNAGAVQHRGLAGYYQSSSAGSSAYGWTLDFYSVPVMLSAAPRTTGISVRCVADGNK